MSSARVLFVEASLGGVPGGSLTGVVELIRRLDAGRFRASLALYEAKAVQGDLASAGVPVHVLPLLPARLHAPQRRRAARAVTRVRELGAVLVPRVRALARLFRQERPDVVYLANGLGMNVDGVIAAALCGLPVVCHLKGLRHFGPLECLASRRIDVAIAMTDEIACHARAQGIRPRRLVTIADGVDCARFAPGGGTAVRQALGIAPGTPVIGLVGHVQEWKGQLLALEATARARRAVPALQCLLVGGVHREGAAYAERLRARMAAPDLAGHVVLAGARRDVAACMDAMDVVLHASLRPEPFGRVLIEAMAVGRPVIAPREGGPRVIVADGETGLLVPPRDPDALAQAIVALLADPGRRAAMGRAARARAHAVFSLAQHVAAVEAVLAALLGLPPGREATAA